MASPGSREGGGPAVLPPHQQKWRRATKWAPPKTANGINVKHVRQLLVFDRLLVRLHQVFGPRWLFQAWPFNKVKGLGPWTSIGAVQLPAGLGLQPTPGTLATRAPPWA